MTLSSAKLHHRSSVQRPSVPGVRLVPTPPAPVPRPPLAFRSPRTAPPAASILDTIGNTPLVRLDRILERDDLRLYAKLELANPGGSAKDRPATRMLEQAMERGEIGPDTVIVESSSGNTAIGLAQFCRYHGLTLRCVVDPRTQSQNLAILRAYGAEIDLVESPDPETGDFLVARLNRVQQLLSRLPDAYWPNQYSNPDNPRSHQLGTICEITEALARSGDDRLDYLFVATSSTGTLGGCQRFLEERRQTTRLVAVDAAGSVLFGGRAGERKIPGMGAGNVSALAQDLSPDLVVRVNDLDCVVGCRRLVAHESILAGGSAGGVIEAVRRVSSDLPEGSVCAAILADGGTRYLDTVYSDDWVEAELGVDGEQLERLVAER